METNHGFLEFVRLEPLEFKLYRGGEIMSGLLPCPPTLGDVLEVAIEAGLSHLWIFGPCPNISLAQPEESNYDVRSFTNALDHVMSVVGRRLHPRSPNVRIIWHARTVWPDVPREEFAALIASVETRLGVPMQASPTSVGLRYLEQIDRRYYRRYFADPGVNKHELKRIAANAAKPLLWWRTPTADELGSARYLIAVDKRAAYPRAAMEPFGVGTASHYSGEFDAALPGIWQVRVQGLDMVDPRLPSPLWPGFDGTLVTPLVEMLLALGCQIEIEEAVVWRQRAPVFRRWVEQLWAARQEIPALKAVMNMTLGFTIAGEEEASEKFRPDWYAQIVGQLRALMIYNVLKIAGESGMYPIGCYIDCLYYASPYTHVPGLLESPASVGGYARKWTLPLDDDIRAMIADPDEYRHLAWMLNRLNTLAKGISLSTLRKAEERLLIDLQEWNREH
jgi:hypothetical protein